MTGGAAALLAELRALDVHLRLEDGRLRVNAPQGRLTPDLEAALIASKAELMQLLRDAAPSPRSLSALPRGDTMMLSFLQERLWVLDRLQPGNTAYNIAISFGEVDDVDIPRLALALRRVVERHEILRVRFQLHGGEPRMRFVDASETPVLCRDLRELSPDARSALLDQAPVEAAHVPFDLANEAPVRFTILQTGERRMALLLAAHHIALDSWSMGLLRAEVMTEYTRLADPGTPPRPVPTVQYADFAQWQRDRMADDRARARLQYWVDALAGLPPMSTIPTDRPRAPEVAGTGATLSFNWSPALTDDLRALARQQNATVYMVLLAAMAVLVARNAGQLDVAIGSPLGTRELAEMEEMLGPILNPLVLRFDVSDDPTFATLIARARTAVLDGHANQEAPFEALVQALKPDRSLGQSPLFQVAVVLHNAPEAAGMQLHGGGAIYDLTLFAAEHEGELQGAFEYRSDLYDEVTIRGLNGQLQALLGAVVRDAQLTVSRMPLLPAAEGRRLVDDTNPAGPALDERTLVAQFLAVAAAHGERTAVTAEDGTLTYAELDRRSWRVATALRAAGAGPGSFVALATDRSTAMVVGALGILKAGAAYVPVDVSYPAERVAFMLSDSGAAHSVATLAGLRGLRGVSLPNPVVIDELLTEPNPDAPAVDGATAEGIAYLMYTSGSTGQPKGVLVPHSAVSSFLGAMRERPGIASTDAVMCVTSMSFDISVLEVFLPLVAGARTIVAPQEVASDGARLAAFIESEGATLVQSTPSGWRLLMAAGWAGRRGLVAIAGGETLPADLAAWMLERASTVWNGYGPTEATVYASMAEIRAKDVITVGTPIANTRLYVLDAALHPVPIGAPGEICIGGTGVARGYHHRAQLTADRFLPDPFRPGQQLYRTGDFGRWRRDGRLEHLGRMDGQVKLRGYRIETAEIEAALSAHEMVRAAVVGVRSASADDPRLVAWVQLHEDEHCTASELRRFLRRTLPEFMIPSMLVLIDALPLTPSAKIDARALPDPFARTSMAPREYTAPSTPTDQLIADVWMRLLGATQVGTNDQFFELGGHSLLAMRAAGEISARTGQAVEPRLLFFRTLGQLAEACDAAAPAARGVVS